MQPLLPCAHDGLELALLFFFVFSSILPYLLLLLYLNSPGKKDRFPKSGVIIYRFYLGLTICTLLVTLFSLFYLPHYFSAGGILWFVLFFLLLYLVSLRRRDPYRYVVIAGEINRIPLVAAVLVCAGGVVYSIFFVLLEAYAIVGVAASELVSPLITSGETTKSSPAADPGVFVPSALEPQKQGNTPGAAEPTLGAAEPTPPAGFVRRQLVSAVSGKVENIVRSPTSEENLELQVDTALAVMGGERMGKGYQPIPQNHSASPPWGSTKQL